MPLEAVPNFSEGRERATIEAIAAALAAHAELLDIHSDVDHNRSVYTLVGDADALIAALLTGISAAKTLERDGGFPGVRALGLALPQAGLVQVSMNVEDFEAAALHEIVETISAEAEALGAEVVGSELVGLMPAGAAVAAAGAMLRIDGFDPSRVLELRLLDRAATDQRESGEPGDGDAW